MNAFDSSGLRLAGDPRPGRTGHWWRATTADGGARGALLLDQSALTAPGAADRIVSTVVATRGLPGVLPIADLVSDSGRVWLITAVPAAPTVAELLAGSGLDAAAGLAIAADTGYALAELHRAGQVHGGFGPETAVVQPSGPVCLIEAGLVPALRGAPVPPAVDASAWAVLARTLAERLAAGPVAELLHRCAGIAESTGLGIALDTLRSGAASPGVPGPRRERLTAAAGAASGPAVSTGRPAGGVWPAPGAGAQTLLPLGSGGSGGDLAGRLGGGPGPGGGAGDGGSGGGPGGDPAEAATRLGRRSAAGGGGRVAAERADLRFGPGVGAANRPPAWPAGQSRQHRRRRRGRLRALASGLLTLALLAGVGGYLWWERQNPLVVTAAVVAPAEPPGDQCDVTVDVVGTVQTNGRGGTVTYQWIRSDGETSAVLDQSVPDGNASTQVHLFWSFSGQGRYQATATLKILAPTPIEASGEFTYACG